MTLPDLIRVIVVDDEAEIRALIADFLGRQGFSVRTAEGGTGLDAALADGPADVILLDVGLPGEDGLAIARRLRRTLSTPIIMVTGADDVVDRVIGLEVGADDYVTKPFDLRELKARIRSVVRRAAAARPQATAAGAGSDDDGVPFGRVRLDLAAGRLLSPDGTAEALSPMDFDLLRIFASHPNRVLSRERILELVSAGEATATPRSVDIRIARLRARLEPDPDRPQVIRTIRGAGYIYVPG